MNGSEIKPFEKISETTVAENYFDGESNLLPEFLHSSERF
jgi:hypothetical protein